MATGWVKLHRSLYENPRSSDPEFVALWVFLLCHATHIEKEILWEGERKTLHPGQLLVTRSQLAEQTGINRSKIERILNCLENEQQIEQQTSPRNRLISITYWNEYQQIEQQIEQQVSNKRAASEQQIPSYSPNKVLDISLRKNGRIKEEDIPPLSPTGGDVKAKKVSRPIEISAEGKEFALWFKALVPEGTKLNMQKSARAYDLLRKDGRSAEEIREVCEFARADEFWKEHVLSVEYLRTSSNGATRYDKILNKMRVFPHGRPNTYRNGRVEVSEFSRNVEDSFVS